MDLKKYYRSLTPDAKERFANDAGTTRRYIETHLLCPDPSRRKTPRKPLMDSLVEASGGRISKEELVAYFFDMVA